MTQTAAETTCVAEVEAADGNGEWRQVSYDNFQHLEPSGVEACDRPIERASDGPCVVVALREPCGHPPEYHYESAGQHFCDGCANEGRGGNNDPFLGRWVHRDRTVEHEATP